MTRHLHDWLPATALESSDNTCGACRACDATTVLSLRTATAADAAGILALVTDHREEGHLLPRALDEIAAGAHRFLVADHAGVVVGCAELAPLSPSLAEVRSLVVDRRVRGAGLGRRLITDLRRRGEAAGFEQLCAFTHRPAWFCRLGFSIVPHTWLIAKVLTTCVHCPLFRRCGQDAVVIGLRAPARRPAVRTVLAS